MNRIKENILTILKNDYHTGADCADVKQMYNAVSKAVMTELYDKWTVCKKDADDKRRVYYLSAEFLIGRAIHSNLLNLGLLSDVDKALGEMGLSINKFEDVDDPALGNGGLGRLAACYLESGASMNINLNGYGIYYKYGLFKQSFKEGFQSEECDDWTSFGDPWSVRADADAVIVKFADGDVLAVPYDMPVVGYDSKINTLRLWKSEAVKKYDFKEYDSMRYAEFSEVMHQAESISYVLYPNDSTEEGKVLRLKQQYFFASASMQDLVRKHLRKFNSLKNFAEYNVMQLNDTHPVIAIPELMRILTSIGMGMNDAFEIVKKSFNFTNHTIMAEALEKWDAKRLKALLPEIYEIIDWLQARLKKEFDGAEKLYIVKNGLIDMANLAVYTAEKVNGVAAIHTEILKNDVFSEWYTLCPKKFLNVTNGITPRRWLCLANPELSALYTSVIGSSWIKELSKLSQLKSKAEDAGFMQRFEEIKLIKKQQLSDYILKHENILLPPRFCFDIQTKRLHEYKRQLLNALSILYIYFDLKEGRLPDFKPTAFIFGAKAAPGYYTAKAVIKFINEIAALINSDNEVSDRIKVVFVQNYNVSYAEKLVAGADISEQISMAGMEASGTGNMKFMLNGTVTLGTMDGANVEIVREAGRENNYIFGLSVEDVRRVKKDYDPKKAYERDPKLKRVVDTLIDGTFKDGGTGVLKAVYDSLVNKDEYLVLEDFEDYIKAKLQAISDYATAEFYKKAFINSVSAGFFSSDRSINNYASDIWKV